MRATKPIPALPPTLSTMAVLLPLALSLMLVAGSSPGAAQPFGDAPPQPTAQLAGSTGTVLAPGVEAAISAAERTRPSRWQADKDRLATTLELHLLAPNGAREHWLAAHFDSTDIAGRVANLAAARVSAPDNRLYLASLADACMQPTRPQLSECAAVDRLADWATRDRDNGVPGILLGYRALLRHDPDTAAADVEEASAAPRFDDYWSASGAEWWNYLEVFESSIDPAARAEAAVTWGAQRDPEWTTALRLLCVDPGATTAPMRSACAKLGIAMAGRAATFALRRAGAAVAAFNADGSQARAVADALQARTLEASARCAEAKPDFMASFESADRSVRERALGVYGRWVTERATLGEVAACDKAR